MQMILFIRKYLKNNSAFKGPSSKKVKSQYYPQTKVFMKIIKLLMSKVFTLEKIFKA